MEICSDEGRWLFEAAAERKTRGRLCELVRTAEINGQVGSVTSSKAAALREETGLDPDISWSDTGKIQLGNEVTVTLTTTVNLGLFGEFASFPVTLTARATGTSEVYWK